MKGVGEKNKESQDNFPVVLCGGSNGTSYFSGLWSSGRLPSGKHSVRVVSRRPDRFAKPLTVRETVQPMEGWALGDSVFAPVRWEEYPSGKVDAFDWEHLGDALLDAKCIWICAPVNAYPEMLDKIMPAAAAEAKRKGRTEKNPLLVCIMYGQGGVDWMAINSSGGALPPGVGVLMLKNFPALISRKGDVVENYGFHPNCGWYTHIPESAAPAARYICKTLFAGAKHASRSWSIEKLQTPLLCTLGGSNQLLHPTIIGGLLGEAPGKSLAEPPKVYRNLPLRTFYNMAACWQETMHLAQILENMCNVQIMNKIGFASPVRNFMKLKGQHWPTIVVSLFCWSAINLSSRLRAARMPLVANPFYGDEISKELNDNQEYVLNTDHRFIVDDVPYGLCVLYGMAMIVDCPMPETAKLIAQLQMYMKKEYVVVRGSRFVLEGRDVHETGAPQVYGIKTKEELLDLIMKGTLPQQHRSKL